MTREELYDIAADAVRDAELKSTEIPAIDLYVDQIINLVTGKLAEGSDRYSDRQLTKTMINNYSKDGIILPVKGKKYNKEQIVQMLSVYSLKNTLSIAEIKRLLRGAYLSEDFGAEELISVYDRHQDIKQKNREQARQLLDGLLDENSLSVEDEEDYFVAICALVSLSAHLKSIAQAMIESKYPEPVDEDEEKDREKEKAKEEKKEEKKEKKEEKKEEKAKEKEKKKS